MRFLKFAMLQVSLQVLCLDELLGGRETEKGRDRLETALYLVPMLTYAGQSSQCGHFALAGGGHHGGKQQLVRPAGEVRHE